ncbi:unnamed protein product [Symbiodinium sp. KB8]|nr:unnamed protein product [Symbiodinium sp. KB8]
MMVRRECLSLFNAVYKYVRSSKPAGSLWRAAQQEILQASSLLPLMCTSLDLPWSPTVMATDSSEVGYGVCERQLECGEVANIGRTCGQWCYAVEGAIRARAHALGESAESSQDDFHYDCARVRDADFREVGADVGLCLAVFGIFFVAEGTLANTTYFWLITSRWLWPALREGDLHLWRIARANSFAPSHLPAIQSFMCVGSPPKGIVLIAPHENHGSRRHDGPWLPIRPLWMAWGTRTLRPMAAPHAPVTKKRTCRIAASANATELTLAGVPSHLEVNKVRRTSTQDRYNAVVET